MIDVEVFSKAGIGKHNEDYVLHTEIAPDISLFVVCDGMGGLSYGAGCVKIIVHSIENYLRQDLCIHNPEQSIINALLSANDELAKECVRPNQKMGGSVRFSLICGECLLLYLVRDVRIYLQPKVK